MVLRLPAAELTAVLTFLPVPEVARLLLVRYHSVSESSRISLLAERIAIWRARVARRGPVVALAERRLCVLAVFWLTNERRRGARVLP